MSEKEEQLKLLAEAVGRADGGYFADTEMFYVPDGHRVDGADERFAAILYEYGVRVHPELVTDPLYAWTSPA